MMVWSGDGEFFFDLLNFVFGCFFLLIGEYFKGYEKFEMW